MRMSQRRRRTGGVQATSRISAAWPLACTAATAPRSSSGGGTARARRTAGRRRAAAGRGRAGAGVEQHHRAGASSTTCAAGAATNAASAARRSDVTGRPPDRQSCQPAAARRAPRPEDALRQADRAEQLRLGQQHLGLAEHEQPVLVQGEGEALQDPRLRLGVKYMSTLRQDSSSTREIGASCSRSCRPKMRLGRRSARNRSASPSASK
jgi:hypothetical protein